MNRKACRKEVKRTLRQIGWAAPKPPMMRQDDVTKLWLASKCVACMRCPRLAKKLARWKLENVLPA